jgi:hypothetical protein
VIDQRAKISRRSCEQLWLFWIVPIAGAMLGGVAYRALFERAKRAAAAETIPRVKLAAANDADAS